MEKHNQAALDQIKAKYGPDAWTHTIDFNYTNQRFFYRTKDLIQHDRMGEVVFAVERPNGRFIAVKSLEYPDGVFRIPTGGVGHGEDILEAVTREVGEELGLKAFIERFIGLNETRLTHRDETIVFYSFFFHLKEIGGRLLEDATDKEVSEVLEADSRELYRLSEVLMSLEKDWKDWGAFRYLTTHPMAEYLEKLENNRTHS